MRRITLAVLGIAVSFCLAGSAFAASLVRKLLKFTPPWAKTSPGTTIVTARSSSFFMFYVLCFMFYVFERGFL